MLLKDKVRIDFNLIYLMPFMINKFDALNQIRYTNKWYTKKP
jgi:hypothetical protein